ncbi:hypothetical protein I2483_01910 [Sporosarcina sp. E16_3]|nr:hypothetical protein [Sporosarcina sp. E16_3]MBO0600405.1 hypothetical protein [Sporosarcina sp. E16_3]
MKSARRRLAPTSAGSLEDKGVLCLFSKTEATEEGSLGSRHPVATAA